MINTCILKIGIIEIISITTLVFNIILFIINIIIVRKNNNIRLQRSVELNFYELTLIKSLKEFFVCIGIINNSYSKLLNEYTNTNDEEKCRILSESAIKELDELYEKCDNEITPYITGFSVDAEKEIKKTFEKYYDATTKIFSMYSQPSLNQTKQRKIQKDYSNEKENLITSLYNIIKGYCPK